MALKLFYYKTLDFLCGRTNKAKKIDAEVGELFVTGKGFTEIPLETLPKLIELKFNDHDNPVPCDNHHDKLHWELKRNHHRYILIVNWHVASVRELVFAIYF